MSHLLTVCIPAYNRSSYLAPLLDSVLNQEFDDFDILICEDCSPERSQIADVVKSFQKHHSGRIYYEENEENLGYDGNIRRLVAHAKGQYCLFMGNDDLLCPGALSAVADVIRKNSECGVVVRSYATFEQSPDILKQVFRYFPNEITIPAGVKAVAAAYRRSVVIPGMVIHRSSAYEIATSEFDGSLLYQLYLVGLILAKRSVVFTPQIIALRRDGVPPDFGNSESEKGKFVPKEQTPESSLYFVGQMLRIAMHVQRVAGIPVFSLIRDDIGSYSYPILAIQARRSKIIFLKYALSLARMGFWRAPLFHAYFATLMLLGPDAVDNFIGWIKRRVGYTPRFGAAKDN